MKRLTVDELWTALRFGTDKFFSVEFQRRTSKPGVPAGTVRKMLCRTGMTKYKHGIISDAARDARDFRHGILTVWSMDSYMSMVRRGVDPITAGHDAWRSIDLITTTTVMSELELSELPPDIRENVHNLTNAFRLANMPRQAIA